MLVKGRLKSEEKQKAKHVVAKGCRQSKFEEVNRMVVKVWWRRNEKKHLTTRGCRQSYIEQAKQMMVIKGWWQNSIEQAKQMVAKCG
mmetsp:Transcript_36303/g.81528  ORF Transcript_36303/g.81528 Transcript_36303/m.81528 type:complete len:87 (+) Transcript_36303:79-339(+)